MMDAGGKEVNVEVNRNMSEQGGKHITRKVIIMVVCKRTGQAVCAGVGRSAKVDSPEPDIVGDAIVPQLQR